MQTTLSRFLPHAAVVIAVALVVAACSSSGTPATSSGGPAAGDDGSVAADDDGGAANADADLGPCDPPKTRCGTACVDLTNDTKNCGKCAKPCAIGCSNSKCMTVCSPLEDCNGICIDLQNDWQNCNMCDNKCPKGQACIAGVCKCGPPKKFSTDIQPIFDVTCALAGCHVDPGPKAGLTLAAGKSYAAIVNVKSGCKSKIRVLPGDADQSYLVDKLIGVPTMCGSMMPSGAGVLASPDFQAIRAWICNGAPND